MSNRTTEIETGSAWPVGAADFFARHTQPGYLDACYECAPPRIQAALVDEVEFFHRVLEGSGRALELGCGNGRLLEALGGSARQWVGVDFLTAYLRDARTRRRLAPSTALTAAQAERLPFADAAFDVVICAQNTLGLLGEQKLPTVQEAVRVTRPGGRALFVLYSEFSLVPRAEWYRQMHRRGLMAILDWTRSTLELMVTEDGHASECFRRRSLEELFGAAGLTPRIQRLGDIYWVVQVQRNSSQEGTG